MAQIRGGFPKRETLSHSLDDGDSVSIALSEAAGGSTSWNIRVFVRTDEGVVLLGTFDTVPGVASRMVGVACCPGARQWTVEAYTADPSATAEIYLADGEGLGVFGVSALETAAPVAPSVPVPVQWANVTLAPGTYYYPSAAGVAPPQSGALSLLCRKGGPGTATFTLELTHDDFAGTLVDFTASAFDVSDVATPYRTAHTITDAGQIALDLDGLRAAKIRCKVVVTVGGSVLISALEGR